MLKQKLKSWAARGLVVLSVFSLCACKADMPTALEEENFAPVSSITAGSEETGDLSGKMHFRIYYANAAGTKLAFETKLADYNKDFRHTDTLAKAILSQMLLPPSNKNLQKTMPENTVIRSVIAVGDCLTVDLGQSFYDDLAANSKTASLVLASVVTTLTELKDISYVTFLCEGKAPSIQGNFTKLSRNTAVVAAALEITTLAEVIQDAVEAGVSLEDVSLE
ncbi:MAG: GerMN domain-containing protein [Clostridia bacterium]|nr:GerMN domain-containing protein [Clostridia bacterium]